MTEEEAQELYKNICNDINCGTFILAPQYVDKLLAKYIDSYKSEELGECRRCVYTDSPCILSDYGKDKNGICDHFKDVFDEIAELKKQHEVSARNMSSFIESLSKSENEAKKQLTKAKDIIKKLYSHVFEGMGFMELNDYNVQKAEIEQFLNSEVEK